jgi:hypothetical protein
MGDRLPKLDLDVGDPDPEFGRPLRQPWSIASLGVPIVLVAVVVANTLYIGLSQGRKDEKLDIVVDLVKEMKAEIYRQPEASRDFALRDERTGELARRVQLLEQAHCAPR